MKAKNTDRHVVITAYIAAGLAFASLALDVRQCSREQREIVTLKISRMEIDYPSHLRRSVGPRGPGTVFFEAFWQIDIVNRSDKPITLVDHVFYSENRILDHSFVAGNLSPVRLPLDIPPHASTPLILRTEIPYRPRNERALERLEVHIMSSEVPIESLSHLARLCYDSWSDFFGNQVLPVFGQRMLSTIDHNPSFTLEFSTVEGTRIEAMGRWYEDTRRLWAPEPRATTEVGSSESGAID